MNKKLTLFLIIIFISILYLFNIDRYIQKKIFLFNHSIQENYINLTTNIVEKVDKYLYSLSYIDQLKKSNNELMGYKLLYQQEKLKREELEDIIKIKKDLKLNLTKIEVLSYYKFNDHSRVIIDKNDLDPNKIYGLITIDGYSAGIVLNKNNTSVAYLNQNKKSNYTVYIGKDKIPGITSGIKQNGDLLIRYVPIWQTVKIGDEVITSSMDNIFPYGIKVGKVTDIKIKDNIQDVSVKPYAKTLGNRIFYLY